MYHQRAFPVLSQDNSGEKDMHVFIYSEYVDYHNRKMVCM